jgi:hypothetical protein
MKKRYWFLLLVVFAAILVIADNKYEELPCELRFRLESQYVDMYSDGAWPQKTSTFTIDELKGDVTAACPQD